MQTLDAVTTRLFTALLASLFYLGLTLAASAEDKLVYYWFDADSFRVTVNGAEGSADWGRDVAFNNPYAGVPGEWDWTAKLITNTSAQGRSLVFYDYNQRPFPAESAAFMVRGLNQGSIQLEVFAGDISAADFRLINNPDNNPNPGYQYDPATGILSLTQGAGVEHGTALLVVDPAVGDAEVVRLGMRVINGAADDEYDWSAGTSWLWEADDPDLIIENPQPDPEDRFGAQVEIDANRIIVLASGEGEGEGLLYLYDRADGSLVDTLEASPYLTNTDLPDQRWLLEMAEGRVFAARVARAETAPDFRRLNGVVVFDALSGDMERVIEPPSGGEFLPLMKTGEGVIAIHGLANVPQDGSECSEDMRQVVYLFDVATGGLLQQIERVDHPSGCENAFINARNYFGTDIAVLGERVYVAAAQGYQNPGHAQVFVYSGLTGELLDTWYPFGTLLNLSPGLTIFEIGQKFTVSDNSLWLWATKRSDLAIINPEYCKKRPPPEPVPPLFCEVYESLARFRVNAKTGQRESDFYISWSSAAIRNYLEARVGGDYRIFLSSLMSSESFGQMISPNSDSWVSFDTTHSTAVDDFYLVLGDAGVDANGINSGRVYVFDLDKDNDQMADLWESKFGLNPASPADASGDADGDLLTNLHEYQQGTRPDVADTDGDGLSDYAEVNEHKTSPLMADLDFDGLEDTEELGIGTSPNDADTDGDSMPDNWEFEHGLDPLKKNGAADPDKDGMVSRKEYKFHTDPQDPDSDDDGLRDGGEQFRYKTSPLWPDSDQDGLSDGDEVRKYATNPIIRDTDGDGLWDGREVSKVLTDPLSPDTDGDSMKDGWEWTYRLNPTKKDGGRDADNDGLSNRREHKLRTHPRKKDTDRDGLPDAWEVEYGTNALIRSNHLDPDRDGYTNLEEYKNGTDPKVADL